MKRRPILVALVLAAGAGLALKSGLLGHGGEQTAPAKEADKTSAVAPVVTVTRVAPADFVETVLVTGSVVAREEIIVAPEVDGLKVVKINFDVGDRVKKGDVLAVLVSETLDAQIAQNDASQARADAAIAQAKSRIVEAKARVVEAEASLERAEPLVKSKYLSESVYDQRLASARTAKALLAAAEDGLRAAEAEKNQSEAVRRELDWRRGKTEVRAPADGIISRRGARVGAIAVGGTIAGAGETLFRLIENGEFELDAEATERDIAKIREGQLASIDVTGAGTVTGEVRLISPEIDPTTRLGRVRIHLGANEALKLGSFGRGTVETARAHSLSIQHASVLYGANGPTVLVVDGDKVKSRRIETGLLAKGLVEVRSGLADGDLIVAKAGTFLRDGDRVKPVTPDDTVSEAGR